MWTTMSAYSTLSRIRLCTFCFKVDGDILAVMDRMAPGDQRLTRCPYELVEALATNGLDLRNLRVLVRDEALIWNGLAVADCQFAGWIELGVRDFGDARAEAMARRYWYNLPVEAGDVA